MPIIMQSLRDKSGYENNVGQKWWEFDDTVWNL